MSEPAKHSRSPALSHSGVPENSSMAAILIVLPHPLISTPSPESVAQLVEHGTFNARVLGSSPSRLISSFEAIRCQP